MISIGLPEAAIPVYQFSMTYSPDSDRPVESIAEITRPQLESVSANRWRKVIISLMLAVGLACLGGFVFFLSEIDNYPDANPSSVSADAIAVLTGGFARLAPAVELLKMERGERLLISGVNPRNSDGSLKNALNIDDQLYECCVDLDQDAMDTIGNAIGISHWANSKNYNKLIIVTNDYHMPRSLIEIERVLGGVELVPFVVRNLPQADEPFSTKFDRYRVLTGEYLKYLATGIRGLFGSSGNTVAAGLSTGW